MAQHTPQDTSLYAQAGVTSDLERIGLPALLHFIKKTQSIREEFGKPLRDVGYYANVIDIPGNDGADGYGLAVCCDGVGTKILIAEMMESYRSIPQDCVAMNVNDLLCVGAEPISFLNYIGIDRHDPKMLTELGEGLYAACLECNITIPGGETAQVGSLLGGAPGKPHFDMTGVALGIVRKDRMNFGEDITPGDVLIGLGSTGLHSNGYSLARKVFFEQHGLKVDTRITELGEDLGDALLRPTALYVKAVVEMFRRGIQLKAINHITGGGFLNLLRVKSDVCFEITALPSEKKRPASNPEVPPMPPILSLLRSLGKVSYTEMCEVYNMGVGMVLTVGAEQVDEVKRIAREHGHPAWTLGVAKAAPQRTVRVTELGLIGDEHGFRAE